MTDISSLYYPQINIVWLLNNQAKIFKMAEFKASILKRKLWICSLSTTNVSSGHKCA